jgi:hypothetical protein
VSLIVGFCRGSNCASKTIGWFGGSYYTHTTTLMPGGKDVLDARSDTVNGIAPGVQLRPVSYLEPESVDWVLIPTTLDQESKVYTALRSQLKKPYDEIGILNYLTGEIRDRNWTDESAWFCDELAVWSWMRSTLLSGAIFTALTPNRITPGGSALIAWALGAKIVTPQLAGIFP